MPTSQPSNSSLPKRTSLGFTSLWRSAELGFTLLRRSAKNGFTLLRRSAKNGFTLIEMLVVLTVIGLVAAAAAQRIGHRPAGLIREEAEARLDLALDTARREAGRTGIVQSISPAALIPGASLAGSLPSPPGASTPDPTGLILVYPDGSSNGGVVTAGGRQVAEIDWLTGEARDAS